MWTFPQPGNSRVNAAYWRWRTSHPIFWEFPYPGWQDDLYASLTAVTPFVRGIPRHHAVNFLLDDWYPLGWLHWWYLAIPLSTRESIAATVLDGQSTRQWTDWLAGLFALSSLQSTDRAGWRARRLR